MAKGVYKYNCAICGVPCSEKLKGGKPKYCRDPICRKEADRRRRVEFRNRNPGYYKRYGRARKDKPKKGVPPDKENGRKCLECGKPLHGAYWYRHPFCLSRKLDQNSARVDENYLYCGG